MSRMSRKPLVISSPTRQPFRSYTALVATVDACSSCVMRARRPPTDSSRPHITPFEESPGVDGTLCVWICSRLVDPHDIRERAAYLNRNSDVCAHVGFTHFFRPMH